MRHAARGSVRQLLPAIRQLRADPSPGAGAACSRCRPRCTSRRGTARFSSPTPCSPVIDPPRRMHSRMISAASTSARSCAPASRPSYRISGCRFPSPAWKTLATRMPCSRDIASIAASASPSRARGTTPSWTMKSGLRRPTAENARLAALPDAGAVLLVGRDTRARWRPRLVDDRASAGRTRRPPARPRLRARRCSSAAAPAG